MNQTPTAQPAERPGRHPRPLRHAALLVEFDTPAALLQAARRLRAAGFTRWDAHAPYPLRGLDEALGLRPTRLAWLVFLCGLAGAAGALLMQWWMNALDYPWIVSGKPLFSLPANIPIVFELSVLLAALGAVFGMLGRNGLPRLHNVLFRSARFRRVTTDRFFISLGADDPKFDAQATPRFLESLGGRAPERVAEAEPTRPPRWLIRAGLILLLLSLIPIAIAARARAARSARPRIHLVRDMDDQERFGPQQAARLFPDGRAMRPPVPGTLAREQPRADTHYYQGKVSQQWATTFPLHRPELKATLAFVRRGRQRFNIYCFPCHGLDGRGDGPVARRAQELEEPGWVPPTSLVERQVRQRPVGHLFNTITNGIRTMPAYGRQIPVADRWAIVAYVRALQRSADARPADVPPDKRAGLH